MFQFAAVSSLPSRMSHFTCSFTCRTVLSESVLWGYIRALLRFKGLFFLGYPLASWSQTHTTIHLQVQTHSLYRTPGIRGEAALAGKQPMSNKLGCQICEGLIYISSWIYE